MASHGSRGVYGLAPRPVAGRSQGERLRVVRNEDGSVARLYWATYPVTREPLSFGVLP